MSVDNVLNMDLTLAFKYEVWVQGSDPAEVARRALKELARELRMPLQSVNGTVRVSWRAAYTGPPDEDGQPTLSPGYTEFQVTNGTVAPTAEPTKGDLRR